MQQITWNQFLARNDLIGGDIEFTEDGAHFRGPISNIQEKENLIVLNCPWIAEYNSGTGNWFRHRMNDTIEINPSFSEVFLNEFGYLYFRIQHVGLFTVYPKPSGFKLDPRKVDGLSREFLN